MSEWQITLEDPKGKLHIYGIEADGQGEAVTIAMDTAFEEMPKNKFRLLAAEDKSESERGSDD